MITLCFLQNQWFKDPERVERFMKNHPASRRRHIATMLFAGCLTGRNLEQCWGSVWCRHVIWEEASPLIAGISSGAFPANPIHMRAVIEEVKPDLIITLGVVATNGMSPLLSDRVKLGWKKHLSGPHPAARNRGETVLELNSIRREMDVYYNSMGHSWK